MALPFVPAKDPAAPSPQRWWLSLFPHLSAATKRSLLLLSLSAALLVSGQLQLANRPHSMDSPYHLPAVQHTLQQLNLPGRDPIGDEFQVNTYTTNSQSLPAVARDNDGDFVVVWESFGSGGNDSSYRSIQGQRYSSLGIPQGGEFQINTYTTGHQRYADIAMDSSGDFVVVWQSYGSSDSDTDLTSIQGQRYNSVGVPQSSQFQVNNYTTGHQREPAISLNDEGDFVIVWESTGSPGNDTTSDSIQGQRYNSVGVPQGDQFQVNSYTTSNQVHPAVALDDDGDFVIVWESNGSVGNDSDETSIQGQRYNSNGGAQSNQFQVNSYTTNDQRDPAISLDSDGDFVVTWESRGSNSGSPPDILGPSIQGQRFNSVGSPQNGQFQVNNYTTLDQRDPAVSLDSDGDFVIAWESLVSSGNDTSYFSVQAKRYNSAGTAQSSEFQVNQFTSSGQSTPAVAFDSESDFVIVWHSSGSYGSDNHSFSIQARLYTTSSPIPTPTPSATATDTPNSSTPSPTPTNNPSPTSTPSITPIPTSTPSTTPTDTPPPTAALTNTPTPSITPTINPTFTPTPTDTPTPNSSATPTSIPTPTPTTPPISHSLYLPAVPHK